MPRPSPLALRFLLLLACPALPAESEAASADIDAWKVPWDGTRPRDPDVDKQGNVWFVGQTGDYLAKFDPKSGEFERFDLPEGAGPHNCVVDERGMVWVAGNRAAYIGRFDPATEELKRFPMPDDAARDPHTLIFDAQGNLWFTVQHGNFVGKLQPATGEIDLIAVPTPRARPYGIKIDGDNRPWIALLGTSKLAAVDPETMEIEEIDLPRPDARPRRLAITDDGGVWYVDYAKGRLGRYDPASESFEEWLAPAGETARPYAMAADQRGRLWFAETGPQPNRLVGFDPAAEAFFSTNVIGASAGATRHMVNADGTLWFGLDTNYLARAVLPLEGGSQGE